VSSKNISASSKGVPFLKNSKAVFKRSGSTPENLPITKTILTTFLSG